jgi:hypothetical protein
MTDPPGSPAFVARPGASHWRSQDVEGVVNELTVGTKKF